MEEDSERKTAQWPDLLLIDGGQGQLNAVTEILGELGLTDIMAVGIAKGPDRDAGRERFYLPDGTNFTLQPNDPVLFYLQRLRDEAHRFVIGAHRQKRQKAISSTPLDDVPGIGPTRKKALLHHFGSARAVTEAGSSRFTESARHQRQSGAEDLCVVSLKNIGTKMFRRKYSAQPEHQI
ncbi:MAG: hypothetical protein WDO70_12450 [Alphaproteobacteria bacterium]